MNKRVKYILISVCTMPLMGIVFVALHYPNNPETSLETKESIEIKIQAGDTFSEIMEDFNVSTSEQSSVLSAAQNVFDFTKLQTGKLMHIVFAQEALASIDYDISAEKKIIVEKKANGFEARESSVEYDITEVEHQVTIESSLFADGASVGLSDKTLIELAKIFAWDIDFTTSIQTGDSFSVVYEHRYRDGEFIGAGDILAARFTNKSKDFYAYMIENKDEKEYYNEEGFSKELSLLKTPLNYSRVSSKFSFKRRNPVTGDVGSHKAVDLTALKGTPIKSVGDGVVEYAGWNGGYGNYIKIKHSGGFISAYAHLSSIDSKIKKGARVAQGQLIGRVGSTGRSTGPHLHYEVYKNGNPVDPFNLDISPSEEIAEELRTRFESVKSNYETRIKT
ncbi:M23 family metallopeptidase [Candidatus Parcubacteria bacterium]|nr:M23 family metallopeptidase [Candidatus Parcubacteria bacterium]